MAKPGQAQLLPAPAARRRPRLLPGGTAAGTAQAAPRELWLAVLPQPGGDAQRLERLARWLLDFTPVVSLEPPEAVLAELRGSLRLFGGAATLRRRVQDELQARGLRACVALAPTPRGALWLARAGLGIAATRSDALPGLAAQLPLSCLGWPGELTAALQGLGVRRLSDLLRLPRDGFARRFGPEWLAELDEALGRRPQPRRRHLQPERFDARLELPCEATGTAALEPALQQLLERLGRFLRRRAAGLAGLQLLLAHRDRAPTRLRLGLARASGDVAHLAGLLQERLGRSKLPAPVTALRLRSGLCLPLEPRSAALFAAGPSSDPDATARLLERLRARLGSEAVFGVRPVAEHRPERAWCVAEPGGPPAPQEPSPGSRRPLWVLAEPQPLGRWDGLLLAGPERIETGWWDGRDVRRDYYVALTGEGLGLWIYRERPPAGGWFLHGVFG